MCVSINSIHTAWVTIFLGYWFGWSQKNGKNAKKRNDMNLENIWSKMFDIIAIIVVEYKHSNSKWGFNKLHIPRFSMAGCQFVLCDLLWCQIWIRFFTRRKNWALMFQIQTPLVCFIFIYNPEDNSSKKSSDIKFIVINFMEFYSQNMFDVLFFFCSCSIFGHMIIYEKSCQWCIKDAQTLFETVMTK